MTQTLHISKDLNLPIDAVTATFCIVGIRGSGKSTTAVDMAEEMLKAKQQIVVLDPKDDWHGIRSSADGNSQGFSVTIFGGAHQDAPLEYTGGALLAELILREQISAIISTKHLSDGHRFKFVYDFCDYLYKHCNAPMHLFMDEADQFAPQEKQTRIQKGDTTSESMMLGLVRRVIKQGRTAGLGVSLITQSPATLDKRVMNMCETLIAMRVVGAQDFDAVERWFKVYLRKKDDLETIVSRLPTLRAGQGVFYSPAWLEMSKIVQFRLAETFDSRATPKVGQRRVEPKVLAPVDLERLSERMAATIEKAKATDPKELNKTINDLRAQVRKLESAKPTFTVETKAQTEIKTIEKRIMAVQAINRLEQLLEAIPVVVEDIRAAIREGKELNAANMILAPVAKPAAIRTDPHELAGYPKHIIIKREPKEVADSNGNISGPMQKILNELAELEAVGISPADKAQLGLFCGYTNVKSGGFTGPLGKLREAELVHYPGSGEVALTDAGRAQAAQTGDPLTTADLQSRIINKLDGPRAKVLRQLIKLYPDSIDKETLGGQLGYTNVKSGGFTGPLGSLRKLGLIEYPQSGTVAASDLLFPPGLS